MLGDVLACMYTNKKGIEQEVIEKYINVLEFSENKVDKPQLIYEIID